MYCHRVITFPATVNLLPIHCVHYVLFSNNWYQNVRMCRMGTGYVRSNCVIPKTIHAYYFEVEILDDHSESWKSDSQIWFCDQACKNLAFSLCLAFTLSQPSSLSVLQSLADLFLWNIIWQSDGVMQNRDSWNIGIGLWRYRKTETDFWSKIFGISSEDTVSDCLRHGISFEGIPGAQHSLAWCRTGMLHRTKNIYNFLKIVNVCRFQNFLHVCDNGVVIPKPLERVKQNGMFHFTISCFSLFFFALWFFYFNGIVSQAGDVIGVQYPPNFHIYKTKERIELSEKRDWDTHKVIQWHTA